MSLYETTRALGLKWIVVPVITIDWGWEDEGPRHLANGKFYGFKEGQGGDSMDGDRSETEEKKDKDEKKKQHPDDEYEEAQAAYLTYGNEPDIGIQYFTAAMLIRMLPVKDRMSGKEPPKSIWAGVKKTYYDYDDYYDEEYDSYECPLEGQNEQGHDEAEADDGDRVEGVKEGDVEAGKVDAASQALSNASIW